MITTIVVAVALYLLIGGQIGNAGWRIWQKKKNNALSYLFFPATTIQGGVGRFTGKDDGIYFVTFNKDAYLLLVGLFWPLKIIWTSLATIAALIFFIVYSAVRPEKFFRALGKLFVSSAKEAGTEAKRLQSEIKKLAKQIARESSRPPQADEDEHERGRRLRQQLELFQAAIALKAPAETETKTASETAESALAEKQIMAERLLDELREPESFSNTQIPVANKIS